jgi:hypothetical protein
VDASVPTATHRTGVGQETAWSPPTPTATVRVVHDEPSLAVTALKEIAAAGSDPFNTQSTDPTHETPSRPPMPAGAGLARQVNPPSVEMKITPTPMPPRGPMPPPTAMQVVGDPHDTDCSAPDALILAGVVGDDVNQVTPPSSVVTIAGVGLASPSMSEPTSTHLIAVAQLMPEVTTAPPCWVAVVHADPPWVVRKKTFSPTARHVPAIGQATNVMVSFDGRVTRLHVTPWLVVATAVPPVPSGVSPTAMQ